MPLTGRRVDADDVVRVPVVLLEETLGVLPSPPRTTLLLDVVRPLPAAAAASDGVERPGLLAMRGVFGALGFHPIGVCSLTKGSRLHLYRFGEEGATFPDELFK